MTQCNVQGLDRLKHYLDGLNDSYIIIGGVACDILLSDADLHFRSTKDVDLIVIAENRLPEIGDAIWHLVEDGGYTPAKRQEGEACFYRFTHPSNPGFPAVIELFSRSPDFLDNMEDAIAAPLPLGDDIASLSAILLDDNYYCFAKSGMEITNNMTVLDELHLIPFKAKAFLDLNERKKRGEHVDSKDIKKHKNDVFRLMQLLPTNRRIKLVDPIKTDMEQFCSIISKEGAPLKQLGMPFGLDEALSVLRDTYNL